MKWKNLKDSLNNLTEEQLNEEVVISERTDGGYLFSSPEEAFVVEDGDPLGEEGYINKFVLYIPRFKNGIL